MLEIFPTFPGDSNGEHHDALTRANWEGLRRYWMEGKPEGENHGENGQC